MLFIYAKRTNKAKVHRTTNKYIDYSNTQQKKRRIIIFIYQIEKNKKIKYTHTR